MLHYKLQIGCIIIFSYIVYHYFYEKKKLLNNEKNVIFELLLLLSGIYFLSDVSTVYTVNHLETVPASLNTIAHLVFLLSLDSFVFLSFLYILHVTESYPHSIKGKIIVWVPFILNVFILSGNIGELDYLQGVITNYSMGVSAYTCFAVSGIYMLATVLVFFRRWRYIEYHKKGGISSYLTILVTVTVFQMLVPESLISSIGILMVILGIYLNIENPTMKKMLTYQDELIQGFAGMMGYKDDSTGAHIQRTTVYAELLARKLMQQGNYKDILTKDYINNLRKAAPMHDIGKIAIPDIVLQKAGMLTDEEFLKMKRHTLYGGEIVENTLQNMGDKEYYQMVYQVAKYHHEKWNGHGYMEGLSGEAIPLCARIMAVVDVFDAISQKRCYRDAMPLEECFEIIKKGRETDFQPELVDAFLECREEISRICLQFRTQEG